MCKLWKAIAERMLPYKDTIYGYDIFNEPLSWAQYPWAPREWRGIAIEIIKAVRSVDKDVWIIYEPGPGGFFHDFANLTPLPDKRVIYSFHAYDPASFCMQGLHGELTVGETRKADEDLNTHYPTMMHGFWWDKKHIEDYFSVVREFQKKWHVPIYVGEFSVIRYAPKDDAARWLKDVTDIFEAYGWSWTYHAFRESKLWSLEHDEKYSDYKNAKGTDKYGPLPVSYETKRAKVIKKAFLKNKFKED